MDLLGEFASGHYDKGAYLARCGLAAQSVQNWQDEGCGFTGACLRQAQQVTTLEDNWDGLLLDRGGCSVSNGLNAGDDTLVEGKLFKFH